MKIIPTEEEIMLAKQLRSVKAEEKDRDFCNTIYFDMQDSFSKRDKMLLYYNAEKYGIIKKETKEERVERLKSDTSHLLWRALYFTKQFNARHSNKKIIDSTDIKEYLDRVVCEACNIFNVSPEEIKAGKKGKHKYKKIRHVIQLVASHKYGVSEIGRYFGADHSTVHHTLRTIKDHITEDEDLMRKFTLLHDKFYA